MILITFISCKFFTTVYFIKNDDTHFSPDSLISVPLLINNYMVKSDLLKSAPIISIELKFR